MKCECCPDSLPSMSDGEMYDRSYGWIMDVALAPGLVVKRCGRTGREKERFQYKRER